MPAAPLGAPAACLACGVSMIGSASRAGRGTFTPMPIFWPEHIAIVTPAISWLTKGEAQVPILQLMRQVASGRARP